MLIQSKSALMFLMCLHDLNASLHMIHMDFLFLGIKLRYIVSKRFLLKLLIRMFYLSCSCKDMANFALNKLNIIPRICRLERIIFLSILYIYIYIYIYWSTFIFKVPVRESHCYTENLRSNCFF